jgi:hypothetical protein
MNTLEDRITQLLGHESDAIPESDRPMHAVQAEAVRQSGRRHRSRVGVAACVAASLVLGGVGIAQVRRDRNETDSTRVATGDTRVSSSMVTVADNYDPQFRLRPVWLPPGTPKGLYIDSTVVSTNYPPSTAIVWAKGDRRAVLTVTKVFGEAPMQSLADAIADARARTPEGATGTLIWWADQPELDYSVQLVADGLTIDDLIALTSRVRVDNEAQVQTLAAPAGFIEIHRGTTKDLQPAKTVTILFVGSAIQVEAGRLEGLSADLSRARQASGAPVGEPVTIRGIAGRQVGSNGVAWTERGWNYSVRAENIDTALRIGNGMQEATPDEWATLTRIPTQLSPALSFDSPPPNRTIELVSDGDVSISVKVPGTADTCAPASLMVGTSNESFCVETSDKLVWWSKTITAGGRRFVVAALSGSVDAVAAATSTPAAGGASMFDENVFVPTSELIRYQGQYVLVGFVAIPIEASVTELDLFAAVPGAPVDDTAPAVEPTDDEPVSNLKLLLRVPIS